MMNDNDNENYDNWQHAPNITPQQMERFSPSLKWIIKYNQNENGTFPVLLDNVPAVMLTDTGSQRNLASTALMSRLKGPYFQNILEQKVIKRITDANDKPLVVLGCITMTVLIQDFSVDLEFFVFHSQRETCILGLQSLKSHNLVIYPKIGLFQVSSEPQLEGQQCLHIVDDKILLEDQQLIFPAAVLTDCCVQPGDQMIVKVKIQVPEIQKSEIQNLVYECLVFHSESVQQTTPIHRLSVIYQYAVVDNNLVAKIRYKNHYHHPISLHAGEVVCHAQILQQASRQQVMSSSDDMAKYVCSLFCPDLGAEAPTGGEGGRDDGPC